MCMWQLAWDPCGDLTLSQPYTIHIVLSLILAEPVLATHPNPSPLPHPNLLTASLRPKGPVRCV
jgi:hypothetical protein